MTYRQYKSSRAVLITGCSSGIGLHAALTLKNGAITLLRVPANSGMWKNLQSGPGFSASGS